ncbi:MAG: HD-GYP domain-containing protein [Solirubrobacteraceae bacterium]
MASQKRGDLSPARPQGQESPQGDPAAVRMFGESLERAHREPAGREARMEAITGAAFVVVATAMAALLPYDQPFDAALAVGLIAAWALSWRIEFAVATGYTSPTMLVLVPMLYLLPPPAVPLCVAAGYLASALVESLQGRRHPVRALLVFGQSWHAVGPALVFSAAGLTEPSFADWPVLALALASSILGDAVASLAVDRFGLRVPMPTLAVPALWVYVIDVLLAPIGLVAAALIDDDPLTILALLPLWVLLWIFSSERTRRLDAALELSHAYRNTALLLGDVIEADHAYTGSHSRQVVELAKAVGGRLGLGPQASRRLEFGALLHDVGKIAVPEAILNKPGALSEQERALMDRHTLAGQDMLESVGGALTDAGRIVRSTHEHWDGRGYPDGLAGATIPLEARVIACCDAWSAMRSDRPYRRALAKEQALAELRRNAGTQFDPGVVVHLEAIVATDAPAAVAEPGASEPARTSQARTATP